MNTLGNLHWCQENLLRGHGDVAMASKSVLILFGASKSSFMIDLLCSIVVGESEQRRGKEHCVLSEKSFCFGIVHQTFWTLNSSSTYQLSTTRVLKIVRRGINLTTMKTWMWDRGLRIIAMRAVDIISFIFFRWGVSYRIPSKRSYWNLVDTNNGEFHQMYIILRGRISDLYLRAYRRNINWN